MKIIKLAFLFAVFSIPALGQETAPNGDANTCQLKIVKVEPIGQKVLWNGKEIYQNEYQFLAVLDSFERAGVVLLESYDGGSGGQVFYRVVVLKDRSTKKVKVYEIGNGKTVRITNSDAFGNGTIQFFFPKGTVMGDPVRSQTWIVTYDEGEASLKRSKKK